MNIVNLFNKKHHKLYSLKYYHLSKINNNEKICHLQNSDINLYPLFEQLENYFNINLATDFDFQAFDCYLINNYVTTINEQPSDLFVNDYYKQLNFPFYFKGITPTNNASHISLESIEKFFYNFNYSKYITEEILYHLTYYIRCVKNNYLDIKQHLNLNFYKKNENSISYHFSKILNNSIHLISKNFPEEITSYELELSHIVIKHQEKGRDFEVFCPAGICHYEKKIMINTNLISYFSKYGKIWDKATVRQVFYHELGHTIHYLYPNQIVKKDGLNTYINKRFGFLENINFINRVKKNYNNFKSSKIDYYIKKDLSYYVKPLNSYLSKNIIEKKVAWNRASQESFAESFSFLISLFINGIDPMTYNALYRNKTYSRSSFKVLMPTIQFLLRNIDWIKLGIPEHLYRKRIPLIKNFLKKINSLPHQLKKDNIRGKNNIRSYSGNKCPKHTKITARMIAK